MPKEEKKIKNPMKIIIEFGDPKKTPQSPFPENRKEFYKEAECADRRALEALKAGQAMWIQ